LGGAARPLRGVDIVSTLASSSNDTPCSSASGVIVIPLRNAGTGLKIASSSVLAFFSISGTCWSVAGGLLSDFFFSCS